MTKEVRIVNSGASILVPEIVARAAKQTPAVKNRPAWLKPASADRIERITAAHRATEQGFKTFAVGAVLAGVDLALLRREAGQGHWADVLTGYLEPAGISQKHVDRYIEVAAATARKHRVDVQELMALPQGGDNAAWQELSDHITASTNATTWRGLIDGLGMARRETRGGYRPDPTLLARYAAENGLEADLFDKWETEEQETFKKWAQLQRAKAKVGKESQADMTAAEKRAEKVWSPVLASLWAACDQPAILKGISAPRREEFARLCRKLAEILERAN
jgi:hypothetical protein